jgi:CDP-glucose 4,6-dehydratase
MGEAVTVPRATALDPGFWRGRRVFLTGHTGFIGGWTAIVLNGWGAEVFGYALPPLTTPSLFDLAGLERRFSSSLADLRDRAALMSTYSVARPDLVIHLAAQPLVGVGYRSPAETFEINVMGTVNLLECVRETGAKAVVVMTSDKVYRGSASDNREEDRLGAHDPYGGSKVCSEVVSEVYARSFLVRTGVPLATVRAGNVVGGGDWSDDRLIPDAVRAFSAGLPLSLRRPSAVRPWQHVLDAVAGLLLVAQRTARGPVGPDAWNIGPPAGRTMSVGEVAALAALAWSNEARVVHDGVQAFPETELLTLDSRRVRAELGHTEPWDLPQSLARTMEWYREALRGADAWALARQQIDDYLAAPTLVHR